MDCNQALELLPSYAVGALSEYEQSQLELHLTAGCQNCQQELDELTAAASLLAEATAPVAPPVDLKQTIMERISTEKQLSKAAIQLSESSTPTRLNRWLSYLPYIAATLCAVALGCWTARSLHGPWHEGSGQTVANHRVETAAWRQRIQATQRSLGPPRIQLAKLASGAASSDLLAALFYDGLSHELHILLSNAPTPAGEKQLWLWLFDEQGNRLAQGRLDTFGNGHAAGIFSLSQATDPVAIGVTRLVITQEEAGEHAEPSDAVVGQARTKQSSE